MKKETRKNLIVLLVFAIIISAAFLLIVLEEENLKKDRIPSVAKIIRVSLNYGASSSSVVEYEYFVSGKRYIGSLPAQLICSDFSNYEKKNIKDAIIPIVYSSSHPNISSALTSKSLAQTYNTSIPDSFVKFVEYTFDCD